jgi:hypothetical protein
MSTNFYDEHNSDGGPLMPPRAAADYTPPPAPVTDRVSGMRDDMVRYAQRDISDPTQLAARLAEIDVQAEAAGWQRPAPDPRTPAQQQYDKMWSGTDTAQTGADAKTGYPASVQPAAIELWSKLPADDPAAKFGAKQAAEAIAKVETWLSGSASREKAAELLALAKHNSLALRSLTAYADTDAAYRRGRPK